MTQPTRGTAQFVDSSSRAPLPRRRCFAACVAAAPLLVALAACKKPSPPTADQARLALASSLRPTFASCTIAFSAPKPELQVLMGDDDGADAMRQMVCFGDGKGGETVGTRCLRGLVKQGLLQASKDAPMCGLDASARLTLGKGSSNEPRVERLVARCEVGKIIVDRVTSTADTAAAVDYRLTVPDGFVEALAPCGETTVAETKSSGALNLGESGRWEAK